MFGAAHKQWKVAILILINTSAPIKFRIVEMETDKISTSAPAGTRSMTLLRPRQTHEPLDYATFLIFSSQAHKSGNLQFTSPPPPFQRQIAVHKPHTSEIRAAHEKKLVPPGVSSALMHIGISSVSRVGFFMLFPVSSSTVSTC